MGGSGGGSYSGSSAESEQAREKVRRELQDQQLAADLNQFLAEELSGYQRDTDAVREKLDDIETTLRAEGLDVTDLGFGGSIAKHTYINGLSDVDVLVYLDGVDGTPSQVIEHFAEVLRTVLPLDKIADVSTGNMAVTITYKDGTQVQLLPATERGEHTVIPSPDGHEWKSVRPHKFTEKLTETNQRNSGGVVPAIKLAKSLVDKYPDAQRLSGYHMEALAVDAFKNYEGPKDRASMLTHLLGHAAQAVLRPSADITGQSLQIDDHLGPANSAARKSVSDVLQRTHNILKGAQSVDDYRQAFE